MKNYLQKNKFILFISLCFAIALISLITEIVFNLIVYHVPFDPPYNLKIKFITILLLAHGSYRIFTAKNKN